MQRTSMMGTSETFSRIRRQLSIRTLRAWFYYDLVILHAGSLLIGLEPNKRQNIHVHLIKRYI